MSYFRDTALHQKAKTRPVGDGKFGARLAVFDSGTKAILKPAWTGNRRVFRRVPMSEFHKREVAAYRLDRDLLGFGIVPETLLIRWNNSEASLQQFVEGLQPKDLVPGVFDQKLEDWKHRIFELSRFLDKDQLTQVVVFDMVINNADRHGKNLVIDTINKRLHAIDNSTSFGPCYACYKNVFHKYFFTSCLEIPSSIIRTLSKLRKSDFHKCLGSLLDDETVEFTYWRSRFIVEHSDRLAFKRVSQGRFDNNAFPSYHRWFDSRMHPVDPMQLLHIQPTPGVVRDTLPVYV